MRWPETMKKRFDATDKAFADRIPAGAFLNVRPKRVCIVCLGIIKEKDLQKFGRRGIVSLLK